MKLVAVALLVLGMLCNSTLAMAEGPVPFSALMQPAGAQPGIPPITDARDQSTAVATQPAHPRRMTTGGKIMTGAGIGMVAIGGVALVGAALLQDWAPAGKEAAGYATGAGLAAGGITLIVFGTHRRSAQ
jgi:hypothetical protein